MGFCPFHTDKRTRSLSIYKDAKGQIRWRCFVDAFGGSEINAVLHTHKGMERSAANRWLTSHGYMQETEQQAKDRVRNEVYAKFLDWTNEMLRTDSRAAGLRAYIAGRNVKAAILPTAPIGYYPTIEEVEVWMSTNSVPEKIAEEFIAAKTSRYMSEGSIVFFYRSSIDQFSRLKLRNVLIEKPDDKDKSIVYLGGVHAKERVGFFSPIMEGADVDHAIVIEGEFDALVLFSMCRTYDPECVEAMYCFGSGGTMDSGITIISNMGIDNIYTFPDNDGPGIDYAFSIAENHPHSFIIIPEDYAELEDPAGWAGKHTFDDLQLAYRQRIPAFAWIGRKLAEEVKGGTIEEQSHAKEKVITYAKKLTPTNREVFLKSYAPITGASYDSLCEEVQNNDRIRYRKVLTSEGFGIQMNVPQKKGDSLWEPISNIVVEHERDLVMDDGFGDTSRELVIRLIMVNKETTGTINVDDYNDDRRFGAFLLEKLGSDVWVKPKHICFVKESAAILPKTGRTKTEELVYTHTGWRDGKFLMPNGYIDAEGFHDLDDVRVELPNNPSMFKMYATASPPADMTLIRSIIRDDILKVFPYDITLPAMAHMFLAPLMHFMPMVKPYCLWVQGLTGSFKTSYVSLLQCLYGDFRTGNFETWRSTANAIEKNGACLKDVSYVLDDYKKADISDKAVVTLLHNYSDKHGRSRMRADMSNQKTWHIRGLLTSTGEDQPNGEASVIARLLLLLIKQPGNTDRLTRGQMHAKLLPGVMAKYIQYLANRNFKEDEITYIIREKEKMFTTGHARIKEVLAVNSFAWDVFADFLGCEDLSPQYYDALQDLKTTMDRTTKAEQAGSMFTDTIRDLLGSGGFYLDGLKGCNGTPHDDHAKRLGWISDEYTYILGSVALAEANTLRTRVTGQPIKYSAQAIYDQLISSGHLIAQGGKPSHVIKIEGSSIRVLKFARGVVEDLDQTYNDPEPEGSEVRFEEDGALLN